MFMGIPPDSIGRGGLDGAGGGASWGERNIEKKVDQGRAKHIGAEVVDWSIDWKALFTNYA